MTSSQPTPISQNAYYFKVHFSAHTTEPSRLFGYARVKAGEFPIYPSGLPLAAAEVLMKYAHDPSEIQPVCSVETAGTRFDIIFQLNAPEESVGAKRASASHQLFGLQGRPGDIVMPRKT